MGAVLVALPFVVAAIASLRWYFKAWRSASTATDDFVVALNLAMPDRYGAQPSHGRPGVGLAASLREWSRGVALSCSQSDATLEQLRQRARSLRGRATWGSIAIFVIMLVAGFAVEAALLAWLT